jgi:hypothetical protein
MNCPICNTQNPPGAESCLQCGFSLVVLQTSILDSPSRPAGETTEERESLESPGASLVSVPILVPETGFEEPKGDSGDLVAANHPAGVEPAALEEGGTDGDGAFVLATPAPSPMDRAMGVSNLVLGFYLVIRHAIVPVAIHLISHGGNPTNELMEPVLIALAAGVFVGFLGKDKLEGRRTMTFAEVRNRPTGYPYRRFDPLGDLFYWVMQATLPGTVAICAPFYIFVDLVSLL